MSMIDRFCYSLPELVEKWNYTEDDILHLGAQNKLWLSVNLDGYAKEGYPPIPISGWWNLLLPNEIGGFFPDRTEAYFTYFRDPKNNTYRTVKIVAGDLRASFLIQRSSIVVMADEVKRYEIENPTLLVQEKSMECTTESTLRIPAPKKGGRKKGSLTQAIEFAYLHFMDQGNTEILRPGKIKEFMVRLKELGDEKNESHIDYISERINSVKISPSGCFVETAEQVLRTDQFLETIAKSKKYKQQDVSKKLTALRKRYPL